MFTLINELQASRKDISNNVEMFEKATGNKNFQFLKDRQQKALLKNLELGIDAINSIEGLIALERMSLEDRGVSVSTVKATPEVTTIIDRIGVINELSDCDKYIRFTTEENTVLVNALLHSGHEVKDVKRDPRIITVRKDSLPKGLTLTPVNVIQDNDKVIKFPEIGNESVKEVMSNLNIQYTVM